MEEVQDFLFHIKTQGLKSNKKIYLKLRKLKIKYLTILVKQ